MIYVLSICFDNEEPLFHIIDSSNEILFSHISTQYPQTNTIWEHLNCLVGDVRAQSWRSCIYGYQGNTGYVVKQIYMNGI